MLILTRRPAETIHIGDDVTVTVLGVVGNQVRFGIEAPRHIAIDRAEIRERKKRALNGATGSAGNVGEDDAPLVVNGNVATVDPAEQQQRDFAERGRAAQSAVNEETRKARLTLALGIAAGRKA